MIFFKRFLDQGTLEKGELLRIIGYILTPPPTNCYIKRGGMDGGAGRKFKANLKGL